MFKSTRATFSFVIFAISIAKLTAIEVFPMPPLFEKVVITLHLVVSLMLPKIRSFIFLTDATKSFSIKGLTKNSLAPARSALITISDSVS